MRLFILGATGKTGTQLRNDKNRCEAPRAGLSWGAVS
jgi:hypothetical protein